MILRGAIGITIFLVLFSCIGCSLGVGKEESVPFSDLYTGTVHEIKIQKGDGETFTVTNTDHIEKAMNILHSVKYMVDKKREPGTGYAYYAALYDDSNDRFAITFYGNKVVGVGSTYYVTSEDITAEFLRNTGE